MQSDFLNSHKKRKSGLIIAVFLLLLGQCYFYFNSGEITDEVKRKYTTGFAYNLAQNFVYYYYYTGLFPVFTTSEPAQNAEAARRSLEESGESLFMECEHWSRLGEHGRIWAFMPNAIFEGNTRIPSIKLFNTLFFILALISVLLAFWLQGKFLTGVLIVVLTGWSPFYLYETYGNENIFALGAVTAYLLLALLLPAIRSKARAIDWMIAPLCGMLVGFICTIRSEILPILLSCIFIFLVHQKYKPAKRLLLIGLVIGAYSITNKVIKAHFDHKFTEAIAVVKDAGGHPYEGGRIRSHNLWHPVFCGLADYDKKYGYKEWRDSIAYAYATPILREQYGLDVHFTKGWHLDEYYDDEEVYYKKFDEIPEYEEVLKEKVLSDIRKDPMWYTDILFKRINKIFNNTIPLGFGNYYLELRGIGWLWIPTLLLFWYRKDWFSVKLLVFVTPLLATSFIIYSGGNSSYNAPYHIIMIALLLTLLIEYLSERFAHKTSHYQAD